MVVSISVLSTRSFRPRVGRRSRHRCTTHSVDVVQRLRLDELRESG